MILPLARAHSLLCLCKVISIAGIHDVSVIDDTPGNIHALHHRMHVPYAFGAFYNTLTESFIVDTIGTTISFSISGLSTRQATMFSTISVLKGVDDHSGYQLPWDPLQWINEQTVDFHDVHHQSWGAKVRLDLAISFMVLELTWRASARQITRSFTLPSGIMCAALSLPCRRRKRSACTKKDEWTRRRRSKTTWWSRRNCSASVS